MRPFRPTTSTRPMTSTLTRLSLALALVSGAAQAQQPAVIFDMGGKFDKSFNQAGYQGAEQWKKESGKAYLEFEISNDTQRVQAIRRMAERGASPIISIGFAQASALQQVAKDFPKTQFAITGEDTRYFLNGALFVLKSESMSLVATDGHRLARRDDRRGLAGLGDRARDRHRAGRKARGPRAATRGPGCDRRQDDRDQRDQPDLLPGDHGADRL